MIDSLCIPGTADFILGNSSLTINMENLSFNGAWHWERCYRSFCCDTSRVKIEPQYASVPVILKTSMVGWSCGKPQ